MRKFLLFVVLFAGCVREIEVTTLLKEGDEVKMAYNWPGPTKMLVKTKVTQNYDHVTVMWFDKNDSYQEMTVPYIWLVKVD